MCMYLLFKMPTSRQVQLLFQQGDYAFSITPRKFIYIFLFFSITFIFVVCLEHKSYPWKVSHSGLVTAPRLFTLLIKPMLFLCCCKGLCVIIYLDDILILTCSKHAGKRAQTFLCSLLVHHGLHINFSKSELSLRQQFSFFWPMLEYSWHLSLPSDKLIEFLQLVHALLHRQPVQIMSFLGKPTFCADGHAQLCWLCHVIQSDMLKVYYSLAHFFLFFTFLFLFCISFRGCLNGNSVQYPCNFLFMIWLLLLMLHPIMWPFIFRVLQFPSPVVASGLVLCASAYWLE